MQFFVVNYQEDSEHAELLSASSQIIMTELRLMITLFETIETIESEEDYLNFLNSELYQASKLPYGWAHGRSEFCHQG